MGPAQAYDNKPKKSVSPLKQRERSLSKDRPDSQLKKKKVPQGFITNISIERDKNQRATEKNLPRPGSKSKNYDVEEPPSLRPF